MKFVKIVDENGKFLTWRVVKDTKEPEITESEMDEHIAAINYIQTIVIFCNVFKEKMPELMDFLNRNDNYEVLR